MSRQKDLTNLFLLTIVSLILVLDLFLHRGRAVTFDGPTHLTTIASFAQGLRAGQFPVSWADGFGNYGMPIPLIAQQTTSYLGALFLVITQNVFVAYNLVYFVGAILSCWIFYWFLRQFAKPETAVIGALLFNFAPYRILNIYTRGAQPEYFASVFIALLAVSIVVMLKKKRWWGAPLFVIGLAGLLFTHPIMMVPTATLLAPLVLLLTWPQWKKIQNFVLLAGLSVLAFMIASFYLLPLFGEIKYFYYGTSAKHLISNQYMGWENYLKPAWYYFSQNDIGPRAQYFHLGSLEMIILSAGIIWLVFNLIKQRKITDWPLLITILTTLGIIFLTLPQSDILYKYILPLNNIQHPWRMFTSLIFLPPLLAVVLIEKLPLNRKGSYALLAGTILWLGIFRFPQIYGKNYIWYPESYYYFTATNLHGNNLNPIWTGSTRDYPVKAQKYDIIDGTGSFKEVAVKNGQREYTISATTPLRLADYTFYFPGWRAYVDGQEVPIEFQDPNYRGVITYSIPAGEHHVQLTFGDTRLRLIGKVISGLGVFALAALILIEKRMNHRFFKLLSS